MSEQPRKETRPNRRSARLVVLAVWTLCLAGCANKEQPPEPEPADANITVQLFLMKVHCYDVNDGGMNGHTDDIYLKKYLSNQVWQSIELGDFKNGTSKTFRNKVIYPKTPGGPGGSTFWLKERDNGPDDTIGAFTLHPFNQMITAGRDARIVPPPANAPAGTWRLILDGSGARYEVTVLVRVLPPTE